MENKKYLNVALPKGRLGEKVYSYFEREGMEAEGIREFYKKFGDKLPAALVKQLEALEARLG